MTASPHAQKHWDRVRAELQEKRADLRAKGFVVCSSEMFFPAGTKFGYVDAGLSAYTTAELEAELRKRR
jgi:hypothetical protein